MVSVAGDQGDNRQARGVVSETMQARNSAKSAWPGPGKDEAWKTAIHVVEMGLKLFAGYIGEWRLLGHLLRLTGTPGCADVTRERSAQ
jgi:hypothetical protein